jgi:hypothetical protein
MDADEELIKEEAKPVVRSLFSANPSAGSLELAESL